MFDRGNGASASRGSARIRREALLRKALLGSTALIGVTLAAPTMAQTYSPAGGGTVTTPSGGATDNTGTGGGVNVSSTTYNGTASFDGVAITNTTGTPTPDALRFTGSNGSLVMNNGGTNALTTTVSGGAALGLHATNSNLSWGISQSNPSSVIDLTGSYGLYAQSVLGFSDLVDFGTTTGIRYVTANGSALEGLHVEGAVGANAQLRASVISGFATGIRVLTGTGTASASTTGGSITATTTGIDADATNGNVVVDTASNIVAPVGIDAQASGTVSVTTRGNVNSTSDGTGTGINAVGGGQVAVTVANGYVGYGTYFATGINAVGAVGATNTITIGAHVRGATGVVAGAGAFTTTVTNEVNGMSASGYGIQDTGGGTIINNGNIWSAGTAVALTAGGSLVNNSSITGAGGTAVLMTGAANTSVNLAVGTTTTGNIVANGAGAYGTTVAGTLNGGYNASSGTSVDTITLASTGSISGAIALGGGNDTLNWNGGTIGSTVDGGAGADTFNVNAGSAAALSLSGVTGFETQSLQSGNLTLSGTGSGAAWTLSDGTTLNIGSAGQAATWTTSGSAAVVNGSNVAVNIAAGSTVTSTGWAVTGASAGATVHNDGMVRAANNAAAIYLQGANSSLQNTGTIAAMVPGANYSVVYMTGANSSVVNSGTITGVTAVNGGFNAAVGLAGADSSFENQADGVVTGQRGVTMVGVNASFSNAGTITATYDNAVTLGRGGTATNSGVLTANGTAGAWGILVSGGNGGVTNSGTINAGSGLWLEQTSGSFTVGNTGTITGSQYGVNAELGTLALTNGNTISGGVLAGVRLAQGGSVSNSGTITGGTDADQGYGVLVGGGDATITNLANGVIQAGTNGTGAVRVRGSGTMTIDLQANSTVNGNIVSDGDGIRNLTIAGALNGTYNASAGTGVDTITLAATGSISNVSLGAGDDVFNWNGGTLSGSLDGGSGTDTLALGGTGTNAQASLASVTGIETLTKSGTGTWTLSGAASGTTAGATVNANGGTLVFNGSGLTGGIYLNGGIIRATAAGGFGTGTIHAIDPTIQYGATGTYSNNISLEVAAPASNDPTILSADAGVTATLTGAITRGGGDTAQPVTIGGAGTIVLANTGNSWTGTTTVNSGATLQGATNTISGGSVVDNGTLAFVQAVDGSFGTVISGSGSVRVDAATHIVTLSGANTYSGATSVTAGTLVASGGSAVGDASSVGVSSGATFQIAANETVGGISGSGTVRVLASTLTVGGDNMSTTFSGSVTDQTPVAYVGSWNVSDGPSWGTNPPTYTGQEAAALLFGGNAGDYRISTAGTSTSNITGTAWYDRYGSSYVELAQNGRTNSGGAGYDMSGDTSAYVRDHVGTHVNYAFTGGVALGGGLTKTGSGTLTLSGTNNYTGLTSILAGTLAVQNGAAIADTGTVNVGAGATFSVLSSETIANLTGSGATTFSGGSVLTLGNATGTYSGALSGSGGLTVNGGTLTLGGAITTTGALTLGGSGTSVTIAGSRTGAGESAVVVSGSATTLNVAATGSVAGGQFAGVRMVASGAINNLGSITNAGTGGDNAWGAAIGVTAPNGTTVITNGSTGNHTATISGSNAAINHVANSAGLLTVNNYAVIDGDRYNGIENQGGTGALTVNNYVGGSITGHGNAGGGNGISNASTAALSVTNSGSISGFTYGVTSVGAATLVNSGTITGGTRAISLGAGADSVTLLAGSTTNGGIALGGGNDTLTWAGGAFTGTIDGGANTDSFISNLGAGNSGALNLASLVNFEGYTSQSGNLTLTGARNGGAGWNVTGGTLTFAANAQLTGVAGNGVSLNVANGTLTLDSGAVLSAASGFAVRAYQPGAIVTNSGTITGSGGDLTDAIYANADLTLTNNGAIHGIVGATDTPRTEGIYVNGLLTLTNNAGAEITGGWVGVRGIGGGTLTNAGTLSGNVFAGAELTGTFTVVNNSGGMIRGNGGSGSGLLLDGGSIDVQNNAGATILGEGDAGVYTRFSGATTITNDGTIQGTGTAYGIRSEIDGLLTVANSGTIAGTGNAISATGQAAITNSGTITGDISLGSANDSVTLNGGSVSGAIALGGGSDTLYWNGGTITGALDGGTGNDGLYLDRGVATTLSLTAVSGFEVQNLLSSSLTLTGTRSGEYGWTLSQDTILNVGTAGQAANWTTVLNGVDLSGANARLNVAAGSSLSAGAWAVVGAGSNVQVYNEGTISVGSTFAAVNLSGTGAQLTNLGTISTTNGTANYSVVYMTGANSSVVNSGTINGVTAGTQYNAAVYLAGANSTIENQQGGVINGQRGMILTGVNGTAINAGTINASVDNGISLANGGSATNSGTINATGTDGAWGIFISGGSGSATNSGTITAGSGIWLQALASNFTVSNSGSITGTQYGVNADYGTLGLVNTNGIAASQFAGVRLGQGGSVTNSGTISGGSDTTNGWGIAVVSGTATITNQAGGTITGGGAGAIALNSDAAVTLDLQAGSTVTGLVSSTGSGTRNVTIAGTLDGAYVSTGSGIDNLVLRGGGTLGSANLSDGDDSFTFYGGTITGLVDGGAGSDTLFADLGAGSAGSIGLDHFVNFDAFGLLSGDVTLTGPSNTPGTTIYAGNGTPSGMITFVDTANMTGDIYVNGGTIRANTAGAFGSGTIHMIDPTAYFGATGIYANNISLEVASPATADPATLSADAGVVATLTGAITQGSGGSIDPAQPLVIAGQGTIVLANGGNSWAGTTTINAGATLQGTTSSISGSDIVANGTLSFAQPTSATVNRVISGTGGVIVSGLAQGETLTFGGTTAVAGGITVLDASSVANSGTITAANGTAVTLANGGSFGNGGTVTGAVQATGTAATSVVNNGTLNGAIFNNADATMTVTNAAGAGIVAGGVAVRGGANGAVLLNNAGDIAGSNTAFLGNNGGDTITNSGRMVSGTISGGSYAVAPGTLAVFLNAGGTIHNQAGGLIAGDNAGIQAIGALTLTNDAGATIEGSNALNAYGAPAWITNAGTIHSTTGDYAIGFGNGGTVVNSGLIQGGGDATFGWGINSTGALDFTNQAGGTIGGGRGAIQSWGGATIDLQAGSTTNGAIQLITSDASTVRIAGAFTGTVGLGSGNDTLTLDSSATIGAGSFFNGNGGVDTLVLAGSGNHSLAIGNLSGFESRTMNGTGAWTLTGSDAMAAGWQINSGTLIASGTTSINDASLVTIAGGATLQLANSETIGNLAGNGAVQLGANTLGIAQGNGSFAGSIGGTGGLYIFGGAGLTLSGANGYTGTTTVLGTLTLGNSGVLADGSSLYVQSGGTVNLQGNDETVAAATLGGTTSGTGTLTAGTINLIGGRVDANLAGTTLAVSGGSTLLNGNAAQANIVVASGTLTLGASQRLADTAAVQVDAGATLALGANNETVGIIGLSGTLAGTGTLTAGEYQLNGASVNANLGTGNLFQLGGTSVLSGVAAAEAIQVQAGTLALGASNRLSDTAAVVVDGGATLDLGANSDTIGTLALAGTLDGAGTLAASQYQLNGAAVNANLGAGSLFQLGGTSVLNGTTGANLVLVQAGTLRLGAADRLADGATLAITSSATLDIAGFEDTVGLVGLSGTLAGTGTLTAAEYQLNGATVNANLGSGNLFQLAGSSVLNGEAAAGAVQVQGGTLLLGASGRLADGAAVVVDAGATLDLGVHDDTVGTLALAGLLDGTGALTANIVQLDGGTVNANLGAGTLVNNSGISTLNGTHAGANVVVDAGTLRLGAANRLADAATLVVASGATLDIGAFDETVGLAGLSGTLAGTGTLTAAEYQLNGAAVNANLGAGNLFQLGGTSVLNGTAGADAVRVQAGTLALGASGRLSDAAVVGVDAGATLDLGANSDAIGALVLAGTLNGTGTLTAGQYQLNGAAVNANLGTGSLFQLGGTSVLNGTAGANLVLVQAGTLRLGATGRIADGAALGIERGATFDLAGFDETVGAVGNGSTGGGTLALGTGRLTLAGNGDSGFSGAITGSGGIDKRGTGRLTLVGDFATTGRIDVSAGSLAFLGSTQGAMRVQGGTLLGSGNFAGALTMTSGTLSPGGLATGQFGAIDPIGSFNAASLAVSGGSLLFDFGGSNFAFGSDAIRVNGAATLTGGTVQVNALSATNQYRFNQLYVLVQAASVSGTFANGASFADVGNNADLKWRLRYDLVANAVVLQVQKNIDFLAGIPAGDPNAAAVAAALNGGAGLASDEWSATLNAISALTPSQRVDAYGTMSGEALADFSATTIGANMLFADLLRQRIGTGDDKLIGTGFTQTSLNDIRATSTSGNSMASRLAGADVTGSEDGGAIWAQAYGGYQRLLGDTAHAGAESTTAGVAMGLENRYGDFTFGVAGGLAEVDADVSRRLSGIGGTQYQLGAYLSYDSGSAFGSLATSYYTGDYDSRRTIRMGATTSLATGDLHADGYSFGGTLGYRADLGGGVRAALVAGAIQTHDVRDAFSERASGGLGLNVAKATRDLFSATGELRIGARVKTGTGYAMPWVSAGVRYNAGDLDSVGNMRFSGAPTGTGAFTVEGVRLSPVLATWGAGIDAQASENVRLGVALEAAYGDRTREGRASVRVKIGF